MLATSGMTHDFFLYPDQFSIIKLNQNLSFFSDVARKTIIFLYCNVVCTVSIIAIFSLFFAAYELNGSRFLQAPVEFGLSTEKVSLKQSLLSPVLFLYTVITYWPVFRLFYLVDWWYLSDENLLHCFIFVHFWRDRIVDGFLEVGELIRYLCSKFNVLCAVVLLNFNLCMTFPGEVVLAALISSVPFVDLLIDFLDP